MPNDAEAEEELEQDSPQKKKLKMSEGDVREEGQEAGEI